MSGLTNGRPSGLPTGEPVIAFTALEAIFDAFTFADLELAHDPDLYERFRAIAGEIFASQLADSAQRMERQLALMEEQAAVLSLRFDVPEVVAFCWRAAGVFRRARQFLQQDRKGQ